MDNKPQGSPTPIQTWLPLVRSVSFEDMNEISTNRFVAPLGMVPEVLGMGTVTSGKLVVMIPDADLDMILTIGSTVLPAITLVGGQISIMFFKNVTGITLINNTNNDIAGLYAVAGD